MFGNKRGTWTIGQILGLALMILFLIVGAVIVYALFFGGGNETLTRVMDAIHSGFA